MGSELEQQLEAMLAQGIDVKDRKKVYKYASANGMKEVLQALDSIEDLQEEKRVEAWDEIVRETMPIEKWHEEHSGSDIEDGLDADDSPDPTPESSEAEASDDSSDSSDAAPEGEADPTTPSTESSDLPDSEAETSEKPATEASDTPSESPTTDGSESKPE